MFTVNVKFWVALGETPLLAVNVRLYVPPVPAAGVPLSVPVLLPLSTNVTPPGSDAPPLAIVGVGYPVVVTMNEPALPTVKVVLVALVIAGASTPLPLRETSTILRSGSFEGILKFPTKSPMEGGKNLIVISQLPSGGRV